MGEPNWKNRTLFHSDNLDFLRAMNSESVDLIATDPPFNKNRDFHATPDSLAGGASFQDRWRWKDDVHEEWTDTLIDNHPAVWETITAARHSWGDDMGAFLCFMAVRLIAMRRLLKPTGSIYLHCDPTASHYLKALMDAIFGRKNFINEIVWCYTGPSNTKRYFPRKHDIILFYSKSKSGNRRFNTEDIRVEYSGSFLNRRNYSEGERGITAGYSEGRNVEEIQDTYGMGKIIEDYWNDIPSGGQISRKERIGFPTQKPVKLYERIIKASSNPDDMVLDPFAGCATTCLAVEKLDRQWVGIDLWNGAEEAILKRMRREGMIPAGKTDEGNEDDKQTKLSLIDLHFTDTLPVRTDDGETDVAFLDTVTKRYLSKLPWQRLSRQQIMTELTDAQMRDGLVVCAGCGRQLESPFMQLDHIKPKSEGGADDISNRILLCQPCNGRKSNQFTLLGLLRENKKAHWIVNRELAEWAKHQATEKAKAVQQAEYYNDKEDIQTGLDL